MISILGIAGSVVVGAAVAVFTVIGIVHHSVDSGSSSPANANSSAIQYGTTQ